jgi:hypothetical protein
LDVFHEMRKIWVEFSLGPMPLDPSCAQFINRTLVVKPTYGWGWHCDTEPLGPSEFAPIDAAGIITFRALELLECTASFDTSSAESRVHYLFAGFWITCAVMQTGTFDFRESICLRYDLSFGPSPPEGEWPLAGGKPRHAGYGVVAESGPIIDDYFASLSQGA